MDSNTNIPKKTDEREYLNTIDRCLSFRGEIIACLESLRSESRWLRNDRSLTFLLQTLRRGVCASEFVESERLAPFLTLVLQYNPDQDNASNFQSWVQYYLRRTNRKRWIWKMISYPVILLTIYVVGMTIMSFTLIPQYRQMYNEFELRLPYSTKRLLWICEQISDHTLRSFLILGLAIACGYGCARLLRMGLDYTQGHRFWGRFSRSSKRQLTAMSQLTSTLAELLQIGAPLSEAFRVAGNACGSPYFRTQTTQASCFLVESLSLTQKLSAVPSCFPSTLIHALQASENQQPSIPLLQQLSRIYADRVEQRIVYTRGILMPFMTLLVAYFIFGMVRDLYAPLISLITSLSGAN